MDADPQGRERGFLVVGVGSLGSARAAAVKAACRARLVAVSDVDAGRAIAVSRRLGVPAVEGLDEGLALPEVSAVVVATPHADHDEIVRRSIEAGKDVLCEKPLTVDPDDARALARLADEAGVKLACGFNHRFYRPVRDALELARSGSIGRVESVRATIGHAATAEFLGGWHADRPVSGGGTLMDNGVHACDLARAFLGEIAAVVGYTRDGLGLPFGVESEAFALLRTHGRGVAEIRSSWSLERGYLTIEVRGSTGYLVVETAPWRLAGRLERGSAIDRRYLGERLREAVHRRVHGCERSLVREVESFVVAGDAARHASGSDGARATEIVDAIYRAAATGSEVALGPAPRSMPCSRASARSARRQ